jgi:hypothetical protein
MKKNGTDGRDEAEAAPARPPRRFGFYTVAALVIAVLMAGYLVAAHVSGGALYTFGLPLGGEEGELRRITLSFLEDLQFKDYQKAATYHAPELQKTVDIPFLLHRVFQTPPETLDIQEYEILWVDLDTSKLRARVRTRVKARYLPADEVREANLMLYFHRDTIHDPWFMVLEDSLRNVPADPNKRS